MTTDFADDARSDAASSPTSADGSHLRGFADLFEAITANVAQVLHGKREAIELAVMCLLAEGHLLIEDVPGVGKTSLAKALAASIDCSWKRIQFTPDLLPTDLVGVSIYQRSTESFVFEPGPQFANILLADEICPDTCRFWDKATNEKLDKDRFRRDLGGVEEAYQEVARRICGVAA